MSRIDQALERARQMEADAVTAGTAPADAPSEALFAEPWNVGHTRTSGAEPKARTSRPVIAPIHAPSAPNLHPNLVEKAIITTGAPPLAVEQYRRLTAKLHHAQLERQVKRLMVISAVASEGKTLSSVNIALTLSRSHKRRVLMIDTDLRKPSLHAAFCVPGEPGLREAVQRPSREPLPIVNIDERLALLPAGKPTTDPLQVLTSERAREIIQGAGEEYDWVIVDTAPLALLPDANVLADVVDAALLVISAGETPHDLVLKAIRLIGRDRILGVVLNGVDPRETTAGQYYAHYYTQS